jgi:hypothetical protein
MNTLLGPRESPSEGEQNSECKACPEAEASFRPGGATQQSRNNDESYAEGFGPSRTQKHRGSADDESDGAYEPAGAEHTRTQISDIDRPAEYRGPIRQVRQGSQPPVHEEARKMCDSVCKGENGG